MANRMNQRRRPVPKKKDTEQKVSGINVFYDAKDRPIYFDRFSKNGYLIKDVEKTYNFYSMRFAIGIIGAIISYAFNLSIAVCIGIGVVLYVFMEFQFRRFLRNLTVYKDFKPEKKIGRIEAEMGMETNKITLKGFLFLVLAVLLVLNCLEEQYTGVAMIINYILAAAALLYALFDFFVLAKKVKK